MRHEWLDLFGAQVLLWETKLLGEKGCGKGELVRGRSGAGSSLGIKRIVGERWDWGGVVALLYSTVEYSMEGDGKYCSVSRRSPSRRSDED